MSIYASNNIEFRIVSSNAICQFKADQAFDFNELVHNPVYKFSHKSREILLLAYDTFFGYILQLEKCFVKHNNKNMITLDLLEEILSLYDACITNINTTLEEHSEFFDETCVEILKQTHKRFIFFARQQIAKVINTSIMIAFPTIVNTISDILNNLLYEIYEVDYLLYVDTQKCKPFLSFSKICFEFYSYGIDILSERLQIYKKYFPLLKNYTIKNYTPFKIDTQNLSACDDIKCDFDLVDLTLNDQLDIIQIKK